MSSSTTTPPPANSSTSSTESAIADLQQLETSLLNELQTARDEDVAAILQKVQQVTTLRGNLFDVLKQADATNLVAIQSANTSISQQRAALLVMEQQLKEKSDALADLRGQKTNSVRQLQINTYFEDENAAKIVLLRYLVVTLVAAMVVILVNRSGLLPSAVFYGLLVLVAAVGGYFFWNQYLSMLYRNNMNYNEFDWNMSANDLPDPDFSANPASASNASSSSAANCPAPATTDGGSAGGAAAANSTGADTTGTGTGTGTGTTTQPFQSMSASAAELRDAARFEGFSLQQGVTHRF